MSNMQFLEKSRKRRVLGEIFVMKFGPRKFVYGRVIRKDALMGGFPNCNLLYIYRGVSEHMLTIPRLRKEELLIPPVGTNNQGWLRGFFKTVALQPLNPEDILEQHCFQAIGGHGYFDEYGHPLAERLEPCGQYGLGSYLTIDDDISTALGVPTASSASKGRLRRHGA